MQTLATAATRPVVEILFVELPTRPVLTFSDLDLSDNNKPDVRIYTAVATAAVTASWFVKSRQKELQGLLNRGVFEVVNLKDILSDLQLFKAQFVNKIKFASTDKAYKKSQLVI